MNVSRRHRFVYLAPPRTASRYVFGLLKGAFPDLQGDPRRTDGVLSHVPRVPPGCEGFYRFASIMAPYERWASVWRWDRQVRSSPAGRWAAEHPDDFEGYTVRAAEQPALPPLAVYLAGVRCDAVVRLERLELDLAALPFVGGRALGVRLEPRPWRELYDAATAALVHAAWRADFDAYGYAADSWKAPLAV